MSELTARNGGRAGLAALVAILLLGLGLRVGEAWDGRPPVYDAAAYARIAAELERGNGFTLGRDATQPASNYSPGLPLFAGGLYALTGGVHERSARVVLALIGALAVLFAYLIGRRLSGPLAGLVAGFAVAIYPALLEYQGMLMGEPLAAALLSAAVLAMFWADNPRIGARERIRAPQWLVPGLLLGTLALVRPEYLAISLPIAVVVFAHNGRDGWRAGLVQALILLVGLAVVVAPWTVRNAVALGRFVPISTGGGQVLFAGSYMPSGGDPEKVGEEVLERHPELRRQLPARRPAGADPGGAGPAAVPGHRNRRGAREDGARTALGRRQRAPGRVPGLPRKQAVADLGPRPAGRDARPRLGGPALAAARVRPARPRGAGGATALGGALLATVLLAATAIGLLLVASPRRALVTLPLLAALAGAGVAWVASWRRRDSLPRS